MFRGLTQTTASPGNGALSFTVKRFYQCGCAQPLPRVCYVMSHFTRPHTPRDNRHLRKVLTLFRAKSPSNTPVWCLTLSLLTFRCFFFLYLSFSFSSLPSSPLAPPFSFLWYINSGYFHISKNGADVGGRIPLAPWCIFTAALKDPVMAGLCIL